MAAAGGGVEVPVFKCYLEDWESPDLPVAQRNTRVVRFQLKDKYVGMNFYDIDYDEHRQILDVVWVNRKGHEVITGLVDVVTGLGDAEAALDNTNYVINSTLVTMIRASGRNPGFRLESVSM